MTATPGAPRRGRRRALDEEEVVETALALLDGGGVEAMSIRGIAARLGVAPNAVYTYFPDKAALVRAVVERLLGEVDHGVFADRARPWRERVEAVAVELRTRLSAHPAAVGLVIGGPMDGAHALSLNEQLLRLLGEAGLDPVEAARASYLLIVYIFGSIALEVADADRSGPLPAEPARLLERRRRFAATPADLHPLTAAAAPVMAGYVSNDQYVWGLHRVLDGIAVGTSALEGS
ncbi:TetR/AcrR family transcriptional regulator [Kineococcus gypseus]|uniref:TetR/AcrR family transcriptional regulator n=1 Tax=Kineococcus gypseus TaxID=1637102 RepID=UPI003D7C366D